MVEKVRKRGKKPSKQRKLESGSHKDAALSAPSRSISSVSVEKGENSNYIPLGGDSEPIDAPEHTPDWIRLEAQASKAAVEAPFGYVDVDVKAYFRAGYDRINELESQGYASPNIVSALKAGGGSSSSTLKLDAGIDSEDELGLLLQATLQEMDGKELSLCTDPDTSVIVEGVLHRLPSKPLRVFIDRLSGNFHKLVKHRFGSHVVQAALSALQLGTTLEHASEDDLLGTSKSSAKRKSKADAAVIVNEDGVLRSSTQLLLDITDELAPEINDLAADAFGSHVVRTLLAVLTGRNVFAASAAERSKRSAKFRSKKGPGSAVASADSTEQLIVAIPDTFLVRAKELYLAVLEQADATEIKRWAIDPVASPLLQLMIEIEAEFRKSSSSTDASSWEESLVNTVLDGLVVESLQENAGSEDNVDKVSKRKDHLESSLRDSVASHVLQLALSHCPLATVSLFFEVYVVGRMGKLCVHAAANHIVSVLLRLVTLPDLGKAASEMGKIGTTLVSEQMVGCLQALVDRVASLDHTAETKALVKKVSGVAMGAFELTPADDDASADASDNRKYVVPVILQLKTKTAYLTRKKVGKASKRGQKRTRDGSSKTAAKNIDSVVDEVSKEDEGITAGAGACETTLEEEASEAPLAASVPVEESEVMQESYELKSAEATMQGSLLLQSLLRLPGSAPPSAVKKPVYNGRPQSQAPVESVYGCSIVYDSLLSLPTLVPFAKNAVSVHVLITALDPTLPHAPPAQRRKLFTALLNHLAAFCGDKYGSRLADFMWATADGYQREKIVNTVIEHNTEILKTQYASFFTNKLNIQLYRKGRIREWTTWAKTQVPPPALSDGRTSSPNKRIVVPVSSPSVKKSSKKQAKIDGELDAILQDL